MFSLFYITFSCAEVKGFVLCIWGKGLVNAQISQNNGQRQYDPTSPYILYSALHSTSFQIKQ